ncbi:MAG: hypothetical protein NT108_02580 [Candidatus Kaiserbacteria bacterium]|nr:hypothetical protein [Candidatus Kaiserbacteria bacterium]
MKSLFFGILAIILIGFGGLVYRNAVEHPMQPIACPTDALVCPDGTSVARVGTTCSFPICPLPNVSLASSNILFAIPEGFVVAGFPDDASIAAYALPATASSTKDASITIRRYDIAASSTALATIQQTAISGVSGLPVGMTGYSSTELGTHRFTVVSVERFEGVIHTAYYLARAADVLRFDAIDTEVSNWTDTNLDTSTLPAHAALRKLLTTLQGG